MTTTYMLELSADELFHLWILLEMRTLNIGVLENDEESAILEKVDRLMEGQ